MNCLACEYYESCSENEYQCPALDLFYETLNHIKHLKTLSVFSNNQDVIISTLNKVESLIRD